MDAEPIVDRDAVELPILEEDFLPEEACKELQVLEGGYTKDIPPLPRPHATDHCAHADDLLAQIRVIEFQGAAADREPRGPDGGHRGEDPWQPGYAGARSGPAGPPDVRGGIVSTLMSLQAKRHAATSLGRSPCSSQDLWGRSATKIVLCLTTS